jgi:hypothetical protein
MVSSIRDTTIDMSRRRGRARGSGCFRDRVRLSLSVASAGEIRIRDVRCPHKPQGTTPQPAGPQPRAVSGPPTSPSLHLAVPTQASTSHSYSISQTRRAAGHVDVRHTVPVSSIDIPRGRAVCTDQLPVNKTPVISQEHTGQNEPTGLYRPEGCATLSVVVLRRSSWGTHEYSRDPRTGGGSHTGGRRCAYGAEGRCSGA